MPLRDDVAECLREHLCQRLDTVNGESLVLVMSGLLARLPLEMPLLTVPDKLVRILDRDLAAAGIPKIDERGRSVDVHAMRHTFATMLSTSGVSPRVAQEAMRHSTMDLTMKVYTDPKLLDVAGAVASLPSMNPAPIRDQSRATGTDSEKWNPPTLTPAGVPNIVNIHKPLYVPGA
jgi:integrase